jgi:hypothetical protein
MFLFLQNASTSVSSSRKRKTSSSTTSSTDTSSSKHTKRSRKNHADPFAGMSDSIQSLASQMQSTSPNRREKAFELLEQDNDLNSDEETSAAILFTNNSAAAHTFCTLKKKKARTAFVRRMAGM